MKRFDIVYGSGEIIPYEDGQYCLHADADAALADPRGQLAAERQRAERMPTMADITMCLDDQCPAREGCYRYKATSQPHYQAYSEFNRDAKDHCDQIWKMKQPGNPKEADHE